MRWRTLPPAGERILLAERDANSALACFHPCEARFFASGTAALAAAVRAAMWRAPRDHAEVLLPAYTCPNVVAAVMHAGAQPRLVDLEPQRPWMSVADLQAKLTKATVAVIAVDFLGIPERYALLAPLAHAAGVTLIQDSAQAFPPRAEPRLFGDFAVLSFGRGKPVSLLGGGAVLSRDAELASLLPDAPARVGSPRDRLRFRLQILAYNMLRSPWLYGLPSALPWLHLGQTRFTPLAHIDGIDAHRLPHLPANIEACRQRNRWRQDAIAEMLATYNKPVTDLALACSSTRTRLARYPLLMAEPVQRDRLYRALRRAGLGASILYEAILPRVRGLETRWPADAYPGADAFARRLLTLPLHDGVARAHLHALRAQFRNILGNSSASPIAHVSS